MGTYFASDYHLGHKNVIKYDNRPFKDVDHMDESIIANHNAVIGDGDDFYFLGDFSFNKSKTEEYLQRLNGNKFFIKGNHDNHAIVKLYKEYGTYLGELAEVDVLGQRIVLCHYSMRVWNKSHRGVWHLYGHSHHSLPDNGDSLSFDIGINGEGYNYTPLSFNQVSKIMSKKTFKSIDHHGE
jgi:calcineurin-like phosphoesterase family protein